MSDKTKTENSSTENSPLESHNSNLNLKSNSTHTQDQFKLLLAVTFISIFVYGILFYLFINRLLKVEVLLGIISIKFIFVSGWVYWLRFRDKIKK